MPWLQKLPNGLPNYEAGATAVPLPGVSCVEVSDQDWQAYLSSIALPSPNWQQFALTMNNNLEWRSLVRTNGAATMLANYVRDRDVENARIYYQDLLAAGDLSPTLQAAIAAAAEQCGLSDLLQQLSE